MKKEIIICFVIVIAVIILNLITINYTKDSVQSLKVELSNIKEDIEHDELEKVHLYIVGIDSNINTDEYSQAIGELDKCAYILEHIEDKYSVNLDNIF